MKLPVEIVFEHVRRSDGIEAEVRERTAWLDQFYDSIMRCRVVVAIPHRHHDRGNHYQVRIDLTVPGEEIVVNHEATLRGSLQDLDEPRITKGTETETVHKHLRVTIREAFDIARRRLQDFARRQDGRVKQHEPPPHGRVVRLFPEEGYGFIESADGREIYFHRHSVLHDRFDELQVGTQVAFAEEPGDKGPQASTVRALGVHHYL
jgi:cold shock CspA family protein/ribosome-associated translation inhibitor RaiA